jgi:hypothetical protein
MDGFGIGVFWQFLLPNGYGRSHFRFPNRSACHNHLTPPHGNGYAYQHPYCYSRPCCHLSSYCHPNCQPDPSFHTDCDSYPATTGL